MNTESPLLGRKEGGQDEGEGGDGWAGFLSKN